MARTKRTTRPIPSQIMKSEERALIAKKCDEVRAFVLDLRDDVVDEDDYMITDLYSGKRRTAAGLLLRDEAEFLQQIGSGLNRLSSLLQNGRSFDPVASTVDFYFSSDHPRAKKGQ